MDLEKGIDVLTKALRDDPEYYSAWQANIAMALVDEWLATFPTLPDSGNIYPIANRAAKRFLDLLILQMERN